MGKQPVRMKAVVYALSPFQQKIMPGLWKDLTGKIHHKVSDNWISTILLLGPLVGTYAYVQNYQEKEKLAHRLESLLLLGKNHLLLVLFQMVGEESHGSFGNSLALMNFFIFCAGGDLNLWCV
ncbi:cytochrome b-c1 complex subunit 8-1 [Citrus sinensis]|nr:cytochrome b-c1 complex subunit 8-1 [Citrus sinensis]